jgi:hypothetical protein
MRSLFTERYVWFRYPYVAFTMLDKMFNMFTLLAGPVTVAYLCTREGTGLPKWVIITSYLVWLLLTRTIKYMPHFVRRPQDVIYVPVWIVFNIYFALMKIYCLFTLHVTDWGTRKGADDREDKEAEMEIYTPHWFEEAPATRPLKADYTPAMVTPVMPVQPYVVVPAQSPMIVHPAMMPQVNVVPPMRSDSFHPQAMPRNPHDSLNLSIMSDYDYSDNEGTVPSKSETENETSEILPQH